MLTIVVSRIDMIVPSTTTEAIASSARSSRAVADPDAPLIGRLRGALGAVEALETGASRARAVALPARRASRRSGAAPRGAPPRRGRVSPAVGEREALDAAVVGSSVRETSPSARARRRRGRRPRPTGPSRGELGQRERVLRWPSTNMPRICGIVRSSSAMTANGSSPWSPSSVRDEAHEVAGELLGGDGVDVCMTRLYASAIFASLRFSRAQPVVVTRATSASDVSPARAFSKPSSRSRRMPSCTPPRRCRRTRRARRTSCGSPR